MSHLTRRTFLKTAYGATLATAISPRIGRASLVNSEVRLGFISCGSRGQKLMQFFGALDGVRIAGLCDPDAERLAKAKTDFPDAKAWTDLRSMIDDPEIDATVISTCNHWHSLAAIWSMESGKDVYVEKPLSQYHWEGEQTVRAVKTYNRICQVGTHQRSDPLQAQIKKLLHEDKQLGEIRSVRANRFGVRQPIGKRSKPIDLANVDANLWFGPARVQDIVRDQLQYDWHWDWNTGSGEMGNWGVHILDDVRNTVFQDRIAFPRKIVGGGARVVWDDAGQTPNAQVAVIDTGDIPVTIAMSNLEPPASDSPGYPGPPSGYVVYCEGGRLEGQREIAVAFDKDGKKIAEFKTEGGNHHHQLNFVEAVRQQDAKILNSNVESGHHSTAWCNMANIACRVGAMTWNEAQEAHEGMHHWSEALASIKSTLPLAALEAVQNEFRFSSAIEFDATDQRFCGPDSNRANLMLRREGREPFVVPEVGEVLATG